MSDEPGTQPSEVTRPGEAAALCPDCGTSRPSGDRFCETCGHDFEAVAAAPATWELIVEADRDYHAGFAAAAGIEFPEGLPPRRVALDAAELRIGRRDDRGPQSSDPPELTGAADDPALSRRHALLRRRDDGGYAIEDLGSTNGTTVNGRPIDAREPRRLADGDRVHLGAWTAMTIRSRGA